MRSAALVVLALAIAPSASDAKCAFYTLEPKILNSGVELASDGGLIVAAEPHQGGTSAEGDVAMQKDWRVRTATYKIAPTIDLLAPGLAVYHPPVKESRFELVDDKGTVLGKAKLATTARAKLAPPKLKAVAHEGTSVGRRPWARVTVTLDGDAPAGAIAIVLADSKGTPRSWGKIQKGEPLYAYSRNRCEVISNGTVESMPGDKVVAFWVDETGRRSDASAVITVGGTVPVTND